MAGGHRGLGADRLLGWADGRSDHFRFADAFRFEHDDHFQHDNDRAATPVLIPRRLRSHRSLARMDESHSRLWRLDPRRPIVRVRPGRLRSLGGVIPDSASRTQRRHSARGGALLRVVCIMFRFVVEAFVFELHGVSPTRPCRPSVAPDELERGERRQGALVSQQRMCLMSPLTSPPTFGTS